MKEPQGESVYFGKGTYAHKVMQDAFLAGILARIASSGPPDSWSDLFADLKFPETDWNFSAWAATRGGNAGNVSRKLAETVLAHIMREGSLPEGTDNLADYLSDNNAEVVIVCRYLNDNGRPQK